MERERKKAEKDAKFKEKKAKQANAVPAASSKSKEKKAAAEKKAEAEILPPYVEETPAGQKKSEYIFEPRACSAETDSISQSSNPSKIPNTKPTIRPLSSPHGMLGGRKKGSSSPSSPQMGRLSKKDPSLS